MTAIWAASSVPKLRDLDLDWQIAARPGQRHQMDKVGAAYQAKRYKVVVRAKIEFPFHRFKQVFGYAKVRYRGLHRNRQRLSILLGLTHLCVALQLKEA